MADAGVPGFDPVALLTALDRHGVRYVLVGGLAAMAAGARRPTRDVDVCAEWTDENLERLAAALRELGAHLRVSDTEEPVPVPIDVRMLKQLELSTWRTDHGDIDVLRGLRKSGREFARYDELMERSRPAQVAGVTVAIADLGDVIRSKEIVDRPQDREALPELRRLRDQVRRRPGPEAGRPGPGIG